MKLNETEGRKVLGYCGLFASRDTVAEAQEYAARVADACGDNKIAVLTAVGVYHNAMVDHILRYFDLALKTSNEGEQA